MDIAKTVFDLAVSDELGRVSVRRRLSRGAFSVFFAQLPASTVVMEACGMAHSWGRINVNVRCARDAASDRRRIARATEAT